MVGSLEQRVAALEEEVRRLRQLSQGATLREPFTVVDKEGRVLLSIARTEHGGQLALYDASGAKIAVLGQAPNGGNGLAVYNSAGKRVAGLFSDENGGHLATYDNEGQGVAGLAAGLDGGHLSVRTREGSNYTCISAQPGGAVLAFFDVGIPVLTVPERSERR